MQIALVELGEFRHAEQPQTADHLVFHQLQHSHDALFALGRQRIAVHAADADEVGAERNSLHDVAAATKAAINHDLGAPLPRGDDLRQYMHRAAAVVELAAAMVGDVDPVDAVVERDLGVLRGGDALDHQRYLELVLDHFHRAPFQPLLEIAAGGAHAA